MRNRAIIKISSLIHRFWYRLTGGAMGGRVLGAPVLLLTTRGRKTGKQRTTPLLYLTDGEKLVIVASNGGADWDPAWWANLRQNPQAEVQVKKVKRWVRAEKASAEEKGRLWPLLTEMYSGYEGYQKGTEREIPVVILRPEG